LISVVALFVPVAEAVPARKLEQAILAIGADRVVAFLAAKAEILDAVTAYP
jgi:hypothetical protein